MSPLERRAAVALSTIFAVRMLGLFLILPVFALYATQLRGATPTLIGIALGAYGLTQALLQIPFGILSDRYGRKPVISLGLVIFIIGSIIAALSDSMVGIIIGRSLQGAGAVGSTIIALATDLTAEQHRTKAMAIIGLSIGLSFGLAMISAPLLNAWIAIPGIFWLTAGLGGLSILILYYWVPTPPTNVPSSTSQTVLAQLGSLLQHPELLRLNIGIFILHALLTALFVKLPLILNTLPLIAAHTGLFYLLILGAAFVSMLPLLIIAEKYQQTKTVFLGAIAVLLLTQLSFALNIQTLLVICISCYLFFTAFTLLEANLPALIAKAAPADRKGAAMGIYSCWQFLGIFVGGSVGGWLYSLEAANTLFFVNAGLCGVWLCLAATSATHKKV